MSRLTLAVVELFPAFTSDPFQFILDLVHLCPFEPFDLFTFVGKFLLLPRFSSLPRFFARCILAPGKRRELSRVGFNGFRVPDRRRNSMNPANPTREKGKDGSRFLEPEIVGCFERIDDVLELIFVKVISHFDVIPFVILSVDVFPFPLAFSRRGAGNFSVCRYPFSGAVYPSSVEDIAFTNEIMMSEEGERYTEDSLHEELLIRIAEFPFHFILLLVTMLLFLSAARRFLLLRLALGTLCQPLVANK